MKATKSEITFFDCGECGRLGGVKRIKTATKHLYNITVLKCSGCGFEYGSRGVWTLKEIK